MSALSTPAVRTYRVEYKRDFHPGSALHWRLYTYGPGHWCVGSGHSGTFRTEDDAREAGKLWIISGRPPCEQKPDILDRSDRNRGMGKRRAA